MSNLLGKPFEKEVKKQIEVRQTALGKYSGLNNQDLRFYNSSAPWLRLASSVRIEDKGVNSAYQKLLKNGFIEGEIIGDYLAQNFILQGGSLGVVGSESSGLNTQNLPFFGAYGWGGIEERGYVPMPGITQANVQYLNNGALTKTTINIRCFSKKQFQLVDILYLRPGYSLLLEFGHSVYLDNDENTVNFDSFSTKPFRTLFEGTKTQYQIYRDIEEERKNRSYNYGAVYGLITNFNWQFNPDGSYDCQIQLSGMGDVIESLKMNTTFVNTDDSSTEKTEETSPKQKEEKVLDTNKNYTLINKKLHKLYEDMKRLSSGDKYKFYNLVSTNIPNPNNNFTPEKLVIKDSLLYFPTSVNDSKTSFSPPSYITLGALLSLIQSRILIYNKNTPLFTFDVDFFNLKEDENYILKFPGEFSSNPNVCLIPYSQTFPFDAGFVLPPSELNEKLKNKSIWETDYQYLGRLMGVFVNFNFITQVISELPQDDENKISLLSFIKKIIEGITSSLGGFNKVQITSTIDGRIKFIEDIPQRNQFYNTDKEEFAKFRTFGVNSSPQTAEGEAGPNLPVEGSFIQDIKLSADLSSDFASMISIGAQVNGNQLSENATAFSNYNLGLTDRIIPEKISPRDESNAQESETEETNLNKLSKNFEEIEPIFKSVYDGDFESNNINSLTSFNTQHAKLCLGILSKEGKEQQIQAPFFLPFNLSLDMLGLSGMVLYQKFRLYGEALPPMYNNDEVDIIIKGINHSITPDKWVTSLDTLSVPRYSLAKVKKPKPIQPGEITPDLPIPDEDERVVGNPNEIESPSKQNAMKKSFDWCFPRFKFEVGCARGVYNLAYNYTKYLRNQSPNKSEIPAGGNANQSEYLDKLRNLGYTLKYSQNGISKNKLINRIENGNWHYGDVLIYWCNDGPSNESHVKYGHTQIFTGDIQFLAGLLVSPKWSTNKKENYASDADPEGNFIYRSRSGNSWNYRVFRAPSI